MHDATTKMSLKNTGLFFEWSKHDLVYYLNLSNLSIWLDKICPVQFNSMASLYFILLNRDMWHMINGRKNDVIGKSQARLW